MNEKWFSFSIAETEKKLKTNAASGLARKAARSAWYKNQRTPESSRPLFIRKNKTVAKMVSEIFADFSLIMLLISAVLAILFDDGTLGMTVIVICSINIGLSLFLYYRSQRTMEHMNLYFVPTAKVIRGGRLYRVSFENIVVGDVILLSKGDIVPADARIVTSDKLSVAMRVDRDKYIHLHKQAEGVISTEENNPSKWVNILHAGSIIEQGSARAIVYAVGTYTYLGAMTGGVNEYYSDNTPNELKQIKKICSQISLFSMLAILPLSIVSLLLSHMNGGTSTLSTVFLTALAICASSMTQLSCTVCKIFFVNKIKDIASSKNPAIIRTTDAFDKLGEMDCLFMLDGSALTDGILHFDTVFTAEGEIKNFSVPTQTMNFLFDQANIYNLAEANALSMGMSIPDRFKIGLDEFLKLGNSDIEALKIRCKIRSYMQGTDTTPFDRVLYTDTEKLITLDISRTPDILSRCSYALISGKPQLLTTVGIDKLRHTYNVHASKGKTVLVFTLCKQETHENIFVGAVVLREGTDSNAFGAIESLKRRGVKVLCFSMSNIATDIPQIPMEFQNGICVNKNDFVRGQLPLTYKFGEIDMYYGLAEDDVMLLMKHAKSQSMSVGVISFSDNAPTVIENADVFISCSSIINVIKVKSEEELYTLEMSGAAASTSCNQTVKYESDILVPRPSENRGGVTCITGALSAVQCAYRSLNSFFKYMIVAQFIRILTVGLPIVFGKPILDARHVLLCSFVMDMIVLLILANSKRSYTENSIKELKVRYLKKCVLSNKYLMISVLSASIFAILLPMLMHPLGVFGQYLYKVEYMLCAVIWLHLGLAYYIIFGSILNIKYATQNKFFVFLCIGVLLFVISITFISPLGSIFDFISIPLPYFLASFLPMVVFSVIFECLTHEKK